MSEYDEDLTENPFFQAILKEVSNFPIFAVLVPQKNSLPTKFEDVDIKAHILQVKNDKTVNVLDEEIDIQESKIQYSKKTEEELNVTILFNETHYLEDQKIKVYCISRPLTDVTFEFDLNTQCNTTETILDVQQAANWISTHLPTQDSNFVLKKYDTLAKNVIKLLSNQTSLKDSFNASIKRNFDKTLQRIGHHVKVPINDKEQFVKACEVYFYHVIYPDLFPYICTHNQSNDSKLNQKILTVTRLKESNLRPDLEVTLPASKANLEIMTQSTCPLAKIEALNSLLELPTLESKTVMNSDDLLPWLIQALSQSSLKNLYSQLDFMSNYHLCSSGNLSNPKDQFNLATLEAALEHIKSSKYNPAPEDLWYFSNEEMNVLYHAIYLGDLCWVQERVNECTSAKCHPLCDCSSCVQVEVQNNNLLLSKDDMNLTNPISLSCWLGQPLIVEYFLTFETIVNHLEDTDKNGRTPLHLAAFHGHQNALLLLLNATKINANARDTSGMTPLHFSAGHGFESCTKALLYNAEHQSYPLQVSIQNFNGDTPLHLACKNGFLNIVKLLLEYGASRSVKNQSGEYPRNVAHNQEIKMLLV